MFVASEQTCGKEEFIVVLMSRVPIRLTEQQIMASTSVFTGVDGVRQTTAWWCETGTTCV